MHRSILNKVVEKMKKYWIGLFILGTFVYFTSCIIVNLTAKMWYNVDMYSDAIFAELMADDVTFFPSEWTFGNQYYIIATPILAGFICKLIGNSFYSLAIASSIMAFLLLISYIWCMKPFLSKKALILGLFALSGGIVWGVSASNYGSYSFGFHLLYTMASYYSCYIIGVFLTVGLFLRLYQYGNSNKLCFWIIIFINFALGMQSLRETLILNIPLILSAFYLLVTKARNSRKILLFSFEMLLSNVIGIVFMKIIVKLINIKSSPAIANLELRIDIQSLLKCFNSEIKNIDKITGLYFNKLVVYDKLFLFIFLGSLFTIFCVILSITVILIKKDNSALAVTISCFAISIFLVFIVGVLFFSNDRIYYFMWYLLATCSICYCYNIIKSKKIKCIFLTLIMFFGLVNYYSNFYIDFRNNYHEKDEFFRELTQEVLDNKIEYVYLMDEIDNENAYYPIYCYSNGRVKIGTLQSIDEDGLAHILPYLKCDYVFDKGNLEKGYFLFSSETFEKLMESEKEDFEKFLSNLQFVREKTYQGNRFNETVRIYKADKDVFYRESNE